MSLFLEGLRQMPSKSTISTFELFGFTPMQSPRECTSSTAAGTATLFARFAVAMSISAPRGGKRVGYYRCGDCRGEFTVRTRTIFERSHVPLNKWLYAMYLVVTSRKGISSLQLSKEIGVTQKLRGSYSVGCGKSAAATLTSWAESLRSMKSISAARTRIGTLKSARAVADRPKSSRYLGCVLCGVLAPAGLLRATGARPSCD